MLSLCMIVKNEEVNLRNCLLKIKDFVDEIVIVDTGSVDNTKIIAREFTDKVYDFLWCDDFAKAKNFSIEKASNDWVLVLDADEIVDYFIKENVQNFIMNPLNENRVGRIKRINIIDDSNDMKKYTEWLNRIFNKNNFMYKGIIHEQIVSKNEKNYETECLDIAIEHIGYTKESLNRTNKIERNIKILKKAIESNSDDPYLYYQIGKSYYMLKDYRNSSLNFENALSYDLNYSLEYVSDLVETYGYCLINMERYSDALILEQLEDLYENNPDFIFVMGLVYMNNALFEKAVNSFFKCTNFTSSKVEGITGYLSFYNIGVIYDVLGHMEEAIKYYRRCENYAPAIKRLRAQLN